MYQELVKFLLEIPKTLAEFGNWLVNPLFPPHINVSPLALLGIAGVGVIITIIGVHIVRLFVG